MIFNAELLNLVNNNLVSGTLIYEATQTLHVENLYFTLHDNGAPFDVNGLGGIAALPNGIEIVVVRASSSEEPLSLPVRAVTSLLASGFSNEPVADSDWRVLRKDFEDVHGRTVRLRNGDRIEVRTQDSLAGLSYIGVSIAGREA